MSERPLPFWISILLLIVCAGLFAIAGPNLYKAAAVKGWIPVGAVRQATVTDKGEEDRGHFWADWTSAGSKKRAASDNYELDAGRVSLNKEQFDGVEQGQKIEVFVVDDESFYRSGGSAQPDNLALNLTLAVIGLLGVGIVGRSWRLGLRRRR